MTNESSAPRPAPETAGGCVARFENEYGIGVCGEAEEDYVHREADAGELYHAYEQPAPPVEARECTCMYDKADPDCPRHGSRSMTLADFEPVEEAQRLHVCTTCFEDEGEDCGGCLALASLHRPHQANRPDYSDYDPSRPVCPAYHPFTPPVEVEDEGARPLDGGAFAHRDYRENKGYNWSVNYPDGKGFPAWVPDEVEAAIRKEAIAAPAIERMQAVWLAGLNEVIDEKNEWRTRAEAAEGALREAHQVILPLAVNGNDRARDAIRLIERARALTAESVTPKEDSDGD